MTNLEVSDLLKLNNHSEAFSAYEIQVNHKVFGIDKNGDKHQIKGVCAESWAFGYTFGGGSGYEDAKRDLSEVSKIYPKLEIIRTGHRRVDIDGNFDYDNYNDTLFCDNPFYQ